jgi:SAM-dependent methyltransferase
MDIEQHNREINENLARWQRKPLLQLIYRQMHTDIAKRLETGVAGGIVEIGSGIGNIKEVIPNCLRTDLFDNPWLDRTENAYALSFADGSLSNLILFDVFHHLRYPGSALREFHRVLADGGRVLIYEPYISQLGRLVYGKFHHEPIGWDEDIEWLAPQGWSPTDDEYYAAQGNASRIFAGDDARVTESGWRVSSCDHFSQVSYVASGGYSGPQLYPRVAYGLMRAMDRALDFAPKLFATRMLVVLKKN